MHDAFKAWDNVSEPLDDTEMRIHDGAARDQLAQRANRYLSDLRGMFPYTIPARGGVVMEVGSGLGWIMQAALAQLEPRSIIGLDVAPSMIAKARIRLRRDRVDDGRLGFLLYDGVTIPVRDDSVDYVYSVAALQHVPKIYVYNLLLEIKRILSPRGFCVIHLLAFSHIRNNYPVFAEEIRHQIKGDPVHWHHFYAFDELLYVLADGVGASQIDIVDGDMSICCAFGKTGPAFHRPELPGEAHLAVVRRAR
jgi:ubiquinone/menaquinone biosynthesis C-methylase UbiE